MAASSASSAEFNFSAALLEHHLGLAEEARVEADSGGEVNCEIIITVAIVYTKEFALCIMYRAGKNSACSGAY